MSTDADAQPTGQPLDLEAIRARSEAATPGSWLADDTSLNVNTADGRALIRIADVLLGDDDTRENHPQATADAAFIAAARTDVPALLAAIDRVTTLVPSRIGAGHRIRDLVANGDGVDVAFYAGVSFALAKVSRALRGDA